MRVRPVEEVAFEIDDAGGLDERGIDVAGAELRAYAEEGVHGPLPVKRHEDQRARGRSTAGRGGRIEGDAGGADVVAEDGAELILRDLADERRAAAERGDADHGIGRRAARDLHGRAHFRIQMRDPVGVDQRHVALGQIVFDEEVVLAAANDVDDGIADANDVVLDPGHDEVPRVFCAAAL